MRLLSLIMGIPLLLALLAASGTATSPASVTATSPAGSLSRRPRSVKTG
ncbi:MAG TPA: hypothetical protein VF043_18385 [Ktedonobacteraceae bacterium]